MLNFIKHNKILRIVLIVLAIEIFIFNFNSFRLMFKNFEKKEYTDANFEITYPIENQTSVKISGIDTEVATIKVEAENVSEKGVEYNVWYTDETSGNYRELPSKILMDGIERSKYTTCYLSGKSQNIQIDFKEKESQQIKINKITINEKVPLNFSIPRFLTLLIIVLLVYLMVTNDNFLSPYSSKNRKQLVIIIAVVLAFIVIAILISKGAPVNSGIHNKFVDALLNKQISLLESPPQELIDLENPYDSTAREGIECLWDVAFYNGHYYVYFGILPFLLLSVPFRIITGVNLQTNWGVLLFSTISIIIISKLIVLLYKKWFKNLSFNYLILAIIGILSGSLIFWVNARASVYEYVLISGVCFSTLGTLLMLKATEKKEVKYSYLCLGALALALAVACRPNHLLVVLIFVPKLIQILVQNIKQRKNIVKLILTVGIPYLIVGISLMIYNYARFDSIVEFGTSYQLTVNDMSKLGNRIAAIPAGLLTQLFKLPLIADTFPFFEHQYTTAIPFYGYYYVSGLVCGLFILNPINFILIFLIGLKKKIKEKQAYNYTCLFMIVALIICVANVMMAGTLQRYSMDYAWILNIASYLTLFIIVNNVKSEEIRKYILKIAIFVTLFMLFVNLVVGGIVSESNLLETNKPKTYYSTRYDICFWE